MACIECQQNNPCAPEPCVQESCACDVFLEDSCITTSEDLTYTGITKGKTLGEWTLALDEFLSTKFLALESFFKLKNVGFGVGKIYKGISILGEKEIKSIKGTNLITVNNLTDEVEIAVNETALNSYIEDNITVDSQTYSVANLGTGASIYKDSTVVGDNTQFNLRKLKSSDNSVTITEGTDDINITASIAGTPPDGSETKVIAGTNVSVSGTGTIATPYVITATDTNTTYSAGIGLNLIGTTFNNVNLQKEITSSYTVTDADDQYTIFINNGATPISIGIDTITKDNFCVGFVQEGTANVEYQNVGLFNPVGYFGKGQGYTTFIERKLNTNTYYLLGDTKIA